MYQAARHSAGKGAKMGSLTTLTVAINYEIKCKVDLQRDKAAAKSLTYNYRVERLTLEELAAHIEARHNIAAVCLEPTGRYHRAKGFFVQSDHLGIDVDNDRIESGEYLTVEAALTDPFISQNAAILYTTPSYNLHHHKFRIVYWLPETVTNRERFEQIARAFIWKHKSDESCKDASRFFYGTGKDGRVEMLGNRLSQSTVDGLLKEYGAFVESNRPKESERVDHRRLFVTGYHSAEARRRGYGERAIQYAQQLIYNSRPPVGGIKGNRHRARVIAAYLLGGYVGGGLLSRSEAHSALEDAVRVNTNNIAAAMKTIEDCLEAGKSEPITFEVKEAERLAYIGQRKKRVILPPVLKPVSKPQNTIILEPPKRPTDTIKLPMPTRPAATTILTAEVAR